MTTGVYAIINTVDGMAYVGSSINIETRWIGHRSTMRACIPNAPRSLHRAWKVYGEKCFLWIVLEVTDSTYSAMERAEQYWMSYFDGCLYNSRKTARRYPTLRYKYKWTARGGWRRLGHRPILSGQMDANGLIEKHVERELRKLERRRPAPDAHQEDRL